jgi:hypothetical protein
VHQVKGVSFAANESHGTHPALLDLPVVYFTSTTAFNIRFMWVAQIASKALPLPPLLFLLIEQNFAFPTKGKIRNCYPTELEDTRQAPTSFITFLALLHLFSGCACLSFLPYTYLDA